MIQVESQARNKKGFQIIRGNRGECVVRIMERYMQASYIRCMRHQTCHEESGTYLHMLQILHMSAHICESMHTYVLQKIFLASARFRDILNYNAARWTMQTISGCILATLYRPFHSG